jgi:hypothetical protein
MQNNFPLILSVLSKLDFVAFQILDFQVRDAQSVVIFSLITWLNGIQQDYPCFLHLFSNYLRGLWNCEGIVINFSIHWWLLQLLCLPSISLFPSTFINWRICNRDHRWYASPKIITYSLSHRSLQTVVLSLLSLTFSITLMPKAWLFKTLPRLLWKHHFQKAILDCLVCPFLHLTIVL